MSCSAFSQQDFQAFSYIALAVLIPSGRTGSDRGYGHQNPYNRNVRNENPYAANKSNVKRKN